MLIGLFLSLFSIINAYPDGVIEELRNDLTHNYSAKQLESFEGDLSVEQDNLSKAYLGVVTMLKSKKAFFPSNKLKYFNKGSQLLDQAISSDSKNIEFRYLRFIFQMEVPSFLDYKSELTEDFNLFSCNLLGSNYDLNYKKRMVSTLLEIKGIKAEHRIILNDLQLKLC
jgi:hypothetical protein